MKIDLHMHTTASDGEYSPTEVVKMVKEKKIEIFAITDHDTTSGIDEALEEANRQGLRLIPGIEFSAKDNEAKKVHILGYNLDYRNPDFIAIYKSYTDDRNRRNNEFIQKFNQNYRFLYLRSILVIQIPIQNLESQQLSSLL